MEQSWHDLLFAHWPLPLATIRAAVPEQLPIDTFDGRAWIGVVPFRVRGLRARWLPAIRGLSDFPELNVRTYVTIDGKPQKMDISRGKALLIVSVASQCGFTPKYSGL